MSDQLEAQRQVSAYCLGQATQCSPTAVAWAIAAEKRAAGMWTSVRNAEIARTAAAQIARVDASIPEG
ncbi:MAG: hypothetical protein ACP5P4_12190 [Steroidobacteraceae bacterium]